MPSVLWKHNCCRGNHIRCICKGRNSWHSWQSLGTTVNNHNYRRITTHLIEHNQRPRTWVLSADEKEMAPRQRALVPKIGHSKEFSVIGIGWGTLQRLSMLVPWNDPKANRNREIQRLTGGCGYTVAFTKQYENLPTISQRETNSVGTCERCEDERCSKARGVEEINGDESDTPRLLFCGRIQMGSERCPRSKWVGF